MRTVRQTPTRWYRGIFMLKYAFLSVNEAKNPRHLDCSRSIPAIHGEWNDSRHGGASSGIVLSPTAAGINLPHLDEVHSYKLCSDIRIVAWAAWLYFLSSSVLSHRQWWNEFHKLFFALLAHCERNQLVTDGLRSQRVSNVELWRFFL